MAEPQEFAFSSLIEEVSVYAEEMVTSVQDSERLYACTQVCGLQASALESLAESGRYGPEIAACADAVHLLLEALTSAAMIVKAHNENASARFRRAVLGEDELDA